MSQNSTYVLWLFGLPCSGKSTLAHEVSKQLSARGVQNCVLDGDSIRSGLCRDLGFDEVDRTENIRRAAEVAKLIASLHIFVICAFITPLKSQRELVVEIFEQEGVQFVFLDCAIDTCMERDVKGMYAASKAGSITLMTGIDSKFEAPSPREFFSLRTSHEGVQICTEKLLSLIEDKTCS